jgi:Uma2 family endonuclease
MDRREATIEDLYRVDGKAEIVGGEIVLMSAAGGFHGYAVGEITASLREYARRTRRGVAFADGVGFIVNLPNRWSFSPDAAFWTGPVTAKFADGAPVFAAEVRSPEDFGPAAERQMAEKRADYFAAGTLVVWDVDVLKDNVVRVYRASDPASPTIYRRGERAEAEPAVPGWSMPVSDLFPPE